MTETYKPEPGSDDLLPDGAMEKITANLAVDDVQQLSEQQAVEAVTPAEDEPGHDEPEREPPEAGEGEDYGDNTAEETFPES